MNPTASPVVDLVSLAQVLRIAADVNRLHLLDRLGSDELTVTQVAERIGRPYQHTSSHLRALWTERLVMRRRSGSHVLYRRATHGNGELIDLVLAWAHRATRGA